MTFIYSLADPETGQIRYVGKSNQPEYRLKTHFRRAEHSKKGRWVAGLAKRGLQPVMEILDEVPDAEWIFWEQHWIQVVEGWGFRLLNMDRGGLGNHRLTAEITAKIAASLKGRPAPWSWRPVHSYAPTGEYIETFPSVKDAAVAVRGSHGNICRAIKTGITAYGRGWSYEQVDVLSLPNFVNGVYVPPEEVRQKMGGIASSMRQKGRVFSLETRQKMSVAARNRRKRERAALAL